MIDHWTLTAPVAGLGTTKQTGLVDYTWSQWFYQQNFPPDSAYFSLP